MLVLVVGLPGAGKSTVARLLAQELGGSLLNSDVIRRELFPEKRTYDSRETGAVIRETERRVRTLLAEGKTVIFDALLTKERPRVQYRHLAETLHVPFALIYVRAPEDATRTRMERRAEIGDASEATFAYYLDRKPHFELPRGEHVIIENTGDLADLERQAYDLAARLKESAR